MYSIPEDQELRKLVGGSKIAPLLMMTAHLSNEPSVLRPEWRIHPAQLPNGTLPEPIDREAREECIRILAKLREAGIKLPERPSGAVFASIAEWALQTDFDPTDLPVLEDFLSFDHEDRRAPDWTLDDLAPDRDFRVVIVGAGISGLLLGARLKQAGVPFVIYDRETDVGGTWKANTYPGARVDVPSHLYVYSFIPYDWSAYFAEQTEVLQYLKEFATRFNLYPHIRFATEVTEATWDEDARQWRVSVLDADGVRATDWGSLFVSAVGQLNKPLVPQFPGAESFSGPSFHSATWDHSVDLADKRVGVIGTGASGLQIVPAVAEIAESVTVFQRNAPWLRFTPELRDPIDENERSAFLQLPTYRAWYRVAAFLPKLRGSLRDVTVDLQYPPSEHAVSAANAEMRESLESALRAQASDSPELQEIIIPTYPPGAKRIVRDDGSWVSTLARDNVSVVASPISSITRDGINTEDGRSHALDAIVYSTGFNAAEFIVPLEVHGVGAQKLSDLWRDDPASYFGLSVPGFPNFFCLFGPNTGVLVHANLVFFFECQVTHIMEATRRLISEDATRIEVREEVFKNHIDEVQAANALRSWGWSGVSSWYKNRHGRSPIMWPLPTRDYWQGTRTVEDSAYRIEV